MNEEHVEERTKRIAVELQGMRGNQREMLTDLGLIRTRLPEIQQSQKHLIWLVSCALVLLVVILVRG